MNNPNDRSGVTVLPPLLMLAALLLMLVLHRFLPLPMGVKPLATVCGVVLAAAGVGLMAWGRLTLTRHGTNVSPLKSTTSVVTAGPYRFTRNPLYVGVQSLFLGISFLLGTWWGFVILVPTFLVLHHGVVLREEQYLERKFASVYLVYKAKVRRYL